MPVTAGDTAGIRGTGATTAAAGLGALAWRRVVAYVETTKFRSVVLLTLGTVVGGVAAMAASGTPGAAGAAGGGGVTGVAGSAAWARLGWATLATMFGCMGANAITGFIDRNTDAVMDRTKHRPLPTGRLVPAESLGFGLALVLLACLVALATANAWAVAWLVFGVFDSTVIYNGLTKPRTPLNVILGSPAGGAPVMVGAAAVSGVGFQLVPFLVAAVVVAWTPVHIWSLTIRHADDYRRAGVPMLPVVIGVPKAARCVGGASLALCGTAVLLAFAARFSPLALALAVALQAPIVLESFSVMRRPAAGKAWLLFKLTSPYLAAVFLLVIWQSLAG